MFISYRNEKKKGHNIDSDNIFILKLNEKITGAISEDKRYGWIFYFNAINDLKLLYQIDSVIKSMFRRVSNFNPNALKQVKSLVKSFYESVYSPLNGYIHNYDIYTTIELKKGFLKNRGEMDSSRNYTDDEVEKLFYDVRQSCLSKLERDQSKIY